MVSKFRNPFDKETGHFYNEPTFFANELEIYAIAFLSFLHAYRHGSRYIWLWFGAIWHGITVELVSYWLEPIDNFWHAQSTFVWFGGREPTQIILLYAAYIYIASMAVHRMGLSELTEAPAVGLMVVIFDVPYDIMGVKLLWWSWHDDDNNIRDRNYSVPWTSYYFHATFACAFNLIYHKSRRYFVGISGLYSSDDIQRMSFAQQRIADNWWGEFKAIGVAGCFAMPTAIFMFFTPLFHYFGDVWHVGHEVTTVILLISFAVCMFYGVMHSKPKNLLEHGEREVMRGDKTQGKGKWYYDEIVLSVLIHYFQYVWLVLFINPETYQVYGLHQEMGSAPGSNDGYACDSVRELTYPYPFTPGAFPSFLRANWFQNVTVSKRPFLCQNDSLNDEGYFNFDCPKARNQSWIPGNEWFYICGTDWNNEGETTRMEYILIILGSCALGLVAFIQPLIYPRTIFEQFFVKKRISKIF